MRDLPKLTRKLVLQTPVKSTDGGGGYVIDWQDQATLWAQIDANDGRAASGETSPVMRQSLLITVRAAPWGHIARPKPGQRFIEGERVYAITGVTEDSPTPLYLRCAAFQEVTL